MTTLLSWISEYKTFLSAAAGASVLLMTLTVLATPWLIAKLPSSYFQNRPHSPEKRGVRQVLLMLSRNLAGLILVSLGIIMMITPGPGMVTILLGLSVAEFPGKHRLLVSLATKPKVLASLNWMRKLHSKPPFEPVKTTLKR